MRSIVLFAALAAAQTADAGEWTPLAPGERWTYTLEAESAAPSVDADGERRGIESAAGERSRQRGLESVEVSELGSYMGRPVYTLATSREIEPEPGDARESGAQPQLSSHLAYVTVDPERGVRETPDPQLSLELPAVGHELPPDPQPGDRWRFSRATRDGGRVELSARVRGFADVDTPAGRYRDCLEVSISGAGRSGALELELEETQWYASRVGLVRERARLRIAEPGRVRVRRLERALTEHEAGGREPTGPDTWPASIGPDSLVRCSEGEAHVFAFAGGCARREP